MLRLSLALCAAALLALTTCSQAQEGVNFSKEVYDSCGVPYSLAPWIVSVRTEGVPFYDPPRPIPKPTGGGGLNKRFGVVWNGLIGGVDGVPNTGAAPRGTLLISKALIPGREGDSLQLSQGPENLAPPEQQEQVRRFVVPFGVPYGMPNCPNGLCPIR
jgi:hypothetical protein